MKRPSGIATDGAQAHVVEPPEPRQQRTRGRAAKQRADEAEVEAEEHPAELAAAERARAQVAAREQREHRRDQREASGERERLPDRRGNGVPNTQLVSAGPFSAKSHGAQRATGPRSRPPRGKSREHAHARDPAIAGAISSVAKAMPLWSRAVAGKRVPVAARSRRCRGGRRARAGEPLARGTRGARSPRRRRTAPRCATGSGIGSISRIASRGAPSRTTESRTCRRSSAAAKSRAMSTLARGCAHLAAPTASTASPARSGGSACAARARPRARQGASPGPASANAAGTQPMRPTRGAAAWSAKHAAQWRRRRASSDAVACGEAPHRERSDRARRIIVSTTARRRPCDREGAGRPRALVGRRRARERDLAGEDRRARPDGVLARIEPCGSTSAEKPVGVARTSQRRSSIARNEAVSSWSRAAGAAGNQKSFEGFTSSSAPWRASARATSGVIASAHTNAPSAPDGDARTRGVPAVHLPARRRRERAERRALRERHELRLVRPPGHGAARDSRNTEFR